MRDYKARHLYRASIQIVGGSFTPIPLYGSPLAVGVSVVSTSYGWTVFDGGGTALSVMDFAERVGDAPMSAEANRRLRVVRNVGVPLAVVGTTLGIGGSVAALVGTGLDEPVVTAAGATAGLVGLVTIFAGLGVMVQIAPYRGFVQDKYTPTDADRLTAEYNERLRVELGLTEAQALEIDLAAGGR